MSIQMRPMLATVMVLVVGLGRSFSFFGKVQKQYQKLAQGDSAYWSLLDSIEQADNAEEDGSGGQVPHFNDSLVFDNVSFEYG